MMNERGRLGKSAMPELPEEFLTFIVNRSSLIGRRQSA